MGSGKSAFILQLLVSGSNSPEQNRLKGFNSLKEYSLHPISIMNIKMNKFLYNFIILFNPLKFYIKKIAIKITKAIIPMVI